MLGRTPILALAILAAPGSSTSARTSRAGALGTAPVPPDPYLPNGLGGVASQTLMVPLLLVETR
jgi:hypothetical protein